MIFAERASGRADLAINGQGNKKPRAEKDTGQRPRALWAGIESARIGGYAFTLAALNA